MISYEIKQILISITISLLVKAFVSDMSQIPLNMQEGNAWV